MHARTLICALLLISTTCTPGAFAQPDERELSRRGRMGIQLEATPEGGIRVTGVFDATAAARCGLEPGDVFVRINGRDASDPASFSNAATSIRAGQETPIIVRRDDQDVLLTMIPDERPPETLTGATVEYGALWLDDDTGVRTLLTRPDSPPDDLRAPDGSLPAVLLIQGIPCASVETLNNPAHPYSQIISRLSNAGFVTLRVDKPGVGESTGTPCPDCGFDIELEAFGAGLDMLAQAEGVDASRLYIVGISMGVCQAPLVAKGRDVAGIVTFGGGVEPWFSYWMNNFRERALISGEDPAQINERMRRWRTVIAEMLIFKKTPDEIRAKYPELTDALELNLDRPAGRHYTFHQELDAHDLASAWASSSSDVLAVHGEYDLIATSDDHRTLVDIVNTHGSGRAEWRVIPGMGHGFTVHDSLEESFTAIGQGRPSTAFYEMCAEWIDQHARSPGR